MSANPSLVIRQAQHWGIALLALWLLCLGDCRAQTSSSERSFDVPKAVVTRGLADLDAYSEGRLTGVDGFVALASGDASHYGRPSYRFRIETNAESANRTRVKVQAAITAWYEASGAGHSGYVGVASNGRLESDLLDRLTKYLEGSATGPARVVPTLDEQISEVRSRRQAVQLRQSELQVQIGELEKDLETVSNLEIVTAREAGTPVMDAPARSAHRLFRAGFEDEFEVVRSQGEWDQVRVGEASTGWIRRAGLIFVIGNGSASAPGNAAGSQSLESNSPFEITQEEVQPFSGNWSGLRGKQTLYVWAQPVRGIGQPYPNDRWSYALRIFLNRGYVAALSTQPYDGVAVIFDEPDGGVIAATLDEIWRWGNGATTALAFRKQCSMDPPAAFIDASQPRFQTRPEKKSTFLSQQ
jgi:hypothetical protein